MRSALRLLGRHRRVLMLLVCVEMGAAMFYVLAPSGNSQGLPPLPLNDLNGFLGLTGYPTPALAPVQQNPEPRLVPVPRADCGAGSRPLAGEQGRVPAAAVDSPQAAQGWTCNVTPLSHFSTPGGFRVWRYVDHQQHECAFYDTSLVSPANVYSLAAGPSPGVEVLDMSNPASPKETAVLSTPGMASPHESLNLNTRRGLLAAEMGNGGSYPGLMDIYDVSQDCRHPVLDAVYRASRFGHESGFAPDGRTFWIGGGEGIAAVDVSDPKNPSTLGDWNVFAHGLNVSDDGNTLYDSEPINGNLVILDVSQVQARKPNPQIREVSRLTWQTVSIPQNTDPMTIRGKPYLLEFDEFAFRFNPATSDDVVGAARIIDISNPAHPRVVSNLRLEVNQQANHKEAAASDPEPLGSGSTDYAAHYCQIPREVDPEIAACSFINSGLRIFNIQDPVHPREVAYYISPPKPPTGSGFDRAGDLAMSQPAFVPARREIWYTDATTGFYAVRVPQRVWPDPLTPAPSCPAARGRVAGHAVGPLHLGETRTRARSQFPLYFSRGTMDFFCLSPRGIRVGYPSARLLRRLPAGERRRVRSRVILVLTSNRHYALDGIHPRASVSAARRRLRVGRGFRIGLNRWYVFRSGAVDGVLKTRRGVVEEVGILDKHVVSLLGARRVMASF